MRNILLLIFITTNIFAKTVSMTGDTLQLSEVVVESNKRQEKVSQTAGSLTAFSNAYLENKGFSTINEISRNVANLTIVDYGCKASTFYSIRGIASKFGESPIGFYIDGVPTMFRSDLNININDIEQVEVLRGPQGTLYGRNALGGIINIKTKKIKVFSFLADAKFGSFGTNEFSGLANIPIIKNCLFAKVSANYKQNDGYNTNDYNGKDLDTRKSYGLNSQIRYFNNTNTEIALAFKYLKDDDGGYPYAMLDSAKRKPYHVMADSKSAFERDLYNATFKMSNYLGSLTINNILSYTDTKQNRHIDQDYFVNANPTIINVFDDHNKSFNYELNFSKKYSRGIFQGGVTSFYLDKNLDGQTDINIAMGPTTSKMITNATTDNRTKCLGFAVFGNTVVNLIEALDLELGLRYDLEKVDFKQKTESKTSIGTKNYPATTSDTCNEKTFTQLLPKVSLKYAFNKEFMAYISFSKGYRIGGFNEMLLDSFAVFKQEVTSNYEIGAKYFTKIFTLAVSLFYTNWEDKQLEINTNQKGMLTKNIGDAKIFGGEVEVWVTPIKHLNIFSNFGLIHSKLEEYNSNIIPLSPVFTANIEAIYSIPAKLYVFDNINLSANYYYQGTQYFDETNDLKQEKYALLGAKVDFSTKNYYLSLIFDNIFDKQYYVYMFKSETEKSIQKLVQMGKPFSVGVKIGIKI